MEKTLKNGAAGEPVENVTLVRTVVADGSKRKLIYCLSNGQYVGSLTIEVMNLSLVKAIGQDFMNFAAEATGGVVVAGAGSVPTAPPGKPS